MKSLNWQIIQDCKISKDTQDNKKRMMNLFSYLSKFNNPQDKLKNVIHVAGTNGKGSTCAFMRSVLEESGFKVAMYTSPHLIKINERFYFNKNFATDEKINLKLEYIKNILGENCKISHFEAEVVLALLLFQDEDCDFNIIEVGLGGEFDATNVFKTKLCSVITSISFDHTDILGNSINEITLAKCGIIKPNIPTFVANQKYDDVVKIIYHQCNLKKSPLNYNDVVDKIDVSMIGNHQLSNASTALNVLKFISGIGFKITDKDIKNGFHKTSWSGRIQNIKHSLFNNAVVQADGAHNEDGIRVLFCYIKETKMHYVQNIGIFSVLSNKDINSFVINMKNSLDLILIYTPKHSEISSPQPFMESEKIYQIFKANNINSMIIDDLDKIPFYIEDKKDNRVIFFGSLYFIGHVYEKFVENL